MTMLLEYMWYLYQGDGPGQYLFDMLLKTATAWKEILHLFNMCSVCHDLAAEGGINASSEEKLPIRLPRKGVSV